MRAEPSSPALVGEIIEDQELWACTTCRACEDAGLVFVGPGAEARETLTFLVIGLVALAIVSIVLSLPTTGPLLLRSLLSQDMYLAGTFLLAMTILLMISNLIADIVLAWADPRIVYS